MKDNLGFKLIAALFQLSFLSGLVWLGFLAKGHWWIALLTGVCGLVYCALKIVLRKKDLEKEIREERD